VESRFALPFLRGTDGQNVFSSLKVVLAMLVLWRVRELAGKRYVLVFYDNNNSGRPVSFLPTVTILLMLETDRLKRPSML
jgi:hypothetical protein